MAEKEIKEHKLYTEKHNMFHKTKLFKYAFFGVFLFLMGCQAYHDTTARFNAYFLAKERMLKVEENLFGNPEDDYNDVLQVLVKLDTTTGKSQKADLDYIIEKASMPIQFHERSKWVDDSWLLIGKSRLYQGDFANALGTFKFVNTTSEDPNARHEAMVLIMRSFVDEGDERNVKFINEYIKKDTIPFAEENAYDYHLTRAHYFRQKYDLRTMIQHLQVALPVAPKNEDRARINFILGQAYEALDSTEQAYESYRKVLKNNPDFDLQFYAEVNSYGLKDVGSEEDVAGAYKFYQRKLKEESNWNLRDKVYYEMGKFEERRGNYDSALHLYNQSNTLSKDNKVQQSYTYLKMGRIFYDEKSEYQTAANYYDSAFKLMPENLRVYEETKTRTEALNRFVKYYGEIQQQDKLQMLAKLDSTERRLFFLEEIEEEKQLIIAETKNNAARDQIRKQLTPPNTSSPLVRKGQATWYFYNLEAVANGKINFIRDWGNRALEDDWRRSRKPFTNTVVNLSGAIPPKETEKERIESKDIFEGVKSLEARMEEIPTDETQLAKSNQTLEENLFELGKLYYYDLKELNNAVETLERFTFDFPENRYVPEAFYLMTYICKEYAGCSEDVYKKKLIEKYPNSSYAQILQDPDFYKKNQQIDKKVAEKYERAFQFYKEGEYSKTELLLQNIISEFPTTSYMDKVDLLRIMTLGQSNKDDKEGYYSELDKFMKKYQESELVAFAKKLKEAK